MHPRNTCTLLACLLASSIGASVTPAIEPTHRDVEYAAIDSRALTLDIYQPDLHAAQPRPLVIWVHGGAWRSGTKASVPVTGWLSYGFAIASVEYRLSPEARFPAQVHDIKAAIRFLRQNASDYHFDSERFVIAGASAGGHLAALVGVTNDHKRLEGSVGDCLLAPSRVQAIVSFYGASNLHSILAQSTEHGLSVRVPALKLLLGGLPDEEVELAELASPVNCLDSADPPLLLVHGDADPQMPPEQSNELHAAYQERRLQSKLIVISEGKHGGSEFYNAAKLRETAKWLNAALDVSQ